MTQRYSFTNAPRPRLRELSLVRNVAQRLAFVVVAVVLINLITMRYRVEGPSMQPTLDNGEILVLNRLAYIFMPPSRGDIVVLHVASVESNDLIKRIVGLPGETLEIRGGQIFINGKLLESPLGLDCEACEAGVWSLGPKDYFLLGDNRVASRDSRSFGPVPSSALVGKVIWRYWPIPQFGPVS